MGFKLARADAIGFDGTDRGSPALSIATLLFLVSLTAWSMLNARPHRNNFAGDPVAATLRHVVEQALPKTSVYERESAMTPTELMTRWEPLIGEAAQQFHIPKEWIRAVMHMESRGRTMLGEGQPITSGAGAMGLMQLMPGTYNEMRAMLKLGADPYDPHDNVFAGAAYLRFLYRKYGNPHMFAAYNDGPGNLEDHLYRGASLPEETRNYVKGIASMLGKPEIARGTVTLTRPDGKPIVVARARIRSIRKALPGEYADGVQAVLVMGRKRQGVRESVADASAAVGVL
ncbi:MAG TPA: lytic transglycosylase domain-containing protein [Rhizomicrobium sp.]|nr:lytic transglycosylase domain-containing protein [Rhizomicrobium sp.]